MKYPASTLRLLKRLIALIALIAWGVLLYEIMSLEGGFNTQAPYCIAGTMAIFSIATLLYKGVERLEAKGV